MHEESIDVVEREEVASWEDIVAASTERDTDHEEDVLDGYFGGSTPDADLPRARPLSVELTPSMENELSVDDVVAFNDDLVVEDVTDDLEDLEKGVTLRSTNGRSVQSIAIHSVASTLEDTFEGTHVLDEIEEIVEVVEEDESK